MRPLMMTPPIAESQLTDAFAAFIGAANRLEGTHRQLHDEVAELRRQLELRNRALASSVAETEQMRILLHQILDASPCGIAVLEVEHEQIILLNPEARKLLEVSETGKWRDLPGSLRIAVKAVNSEAWANRYEQEILVEKGGQKLWLAIRYSRITNSGSVTLLADSSSLVLIISDVTAHKNAEQEREKSRNVVALAEVASVLAHEIRNPLGSLELLTGCLTADPALGEESKRCVQHLRAGVRSLSATVNNVLCFHNPGMQQLCPTELGSVLKGSVEFVRPLAQQKSINLTLRETLGNAEVAGDSNGLRQMILNLTCNALRHTPPDGEITITAGLKASASGTMAVLEFGDTGSGIRPEDLPHIFEVGFSTTGQTPGLGLTVCQRIVAQHHGTISVRSKWGQGATFRMEFPVL